MFRFINNNNRIIVAAPVKNLISPGKNDPGCYYPLHAIDEINEKKWQQDSKEKSCDED